ncbi:L-lysine 6-monooxygenase [Photobacterium sp. SKA34]|uniref:lysine N(6)-hydroxylase/L-ornithine N(5)-oxygenase family protein n=1 Tax=Photobacterium sp. SKA34 TaxID=121723 RepID=UPI00006B89ED|nr:SidA/IucD/PvdA family monooxygenase [Photobacterium sp. SKA34]EAR55207.1 L-lysine 6-monooxygenase [Photobacterium sp. SKA34]
MNNNKNEILDLAGIGAGPFNLSVAALAEEVSTLKTCFFEGRDQFTWHPGLLLDDTHMQTMFLKDLVTAVAPQSPYSFVSYLVSEKKLYRFLSTELTCISRHEFSNYLKWASEKLPNVQFATKVEKINFDEKNAIFEIHTNKGMYRARNIFLGTGKVPYLPECAKPHIGERVIHAVEIGLRERDLSDKKVAIIGGGQSGADIFLNVMRGKWGQPACLDWISRRANFQPLDEAAFTNEFFTPEYVEVFCQLKDEVKLKELSSQKLTSDGITQNALLNIYRELYHRFDVLKEKRWVRMLPHRELQQLSSEKNSYKMTVKNALSENDELLNADIVILATGFKSSFPPCLDHMRSLIELNCCGNLSLNRHFEVNWAGSLNNRIFAVNAGIHSHGIAEPQLSLMAWRSANIINHLCQREIFDIDSERGVIEWLTQEYELEAIC